MARTQVKVEVVFFHDINTDRYIDSFREMHNLEDDDEVDKETLEEFAKQSFAEELENGDISFDDFHDVTIEKVS